MKTGLLEFFGASDLWVATVRCNQQSRYGLFDAVGFGRTPDKAIKQCLRNAADLHDENEAVDFSIYQLGNGFAFQTRHMPSSNGNEPKPNGSQP